MILTFGDRRTEDLFHGTGSARVRSLPPDVVRVALRKLDLVEAAHRLQDLRVPPGNRLELLHGDLKGFHSVRVNAQWRLVSRWSADGARDVRLVDYH